MGVFITSQQPGPTWQRMEAVRLTVTMVHI